MGWWDQFCDTVSGAIHSFEDFCNHVISTIGFTFVGIEAFIQFLGENGLNPIEVIPDLANRASSKGADSIQVLEEVAGGIIHEGWSGYSNRLINQHIINPAKRLLELHTQQSMRLGTIHQTTLKTVQQKLLALRQDDGAGTVPLSGLLADQVDAHYTTTARTMKQLLSSGDDPWQQAAERQQVILQQTLALYDIHGQYMQTVVKIDIVIWIVELVALVVVGAVTEGGGVLLLGPLFADLDLGILGTELLAPLIYWAGASLANIANFVVTKLKQPAAQQVQAPPTTQQQNTNPDPEPTPSPIVDPIPPDPDAPDRTKDEQCSPQDWASFTTMFGLGYVERMQTEHPLYACFILKELRDIQTRKPGWMGGLYLVEGNLLFAGKDSPATGESPTFQGAFFQLQWVHDHLDSVKDTEVVGNDGLQGPDAELYDGTLVDFKDWSYKTLQSNLNELKKQVARFRDAFPPPPPRVIHFVFNATACGGKVPDNVLNWIKSQAPSVTYELWTPPISD